MLSKIKKIVTKLRKSYWTFRVSKKAKVVKGDLHVNHASYVTKNTFLGKNVNFNGMKIIGKGKVSIGDNFHSGFGCVIMSHYHNFKTSESIPYDRTYIVEDVVIEDNVWFGINVIVLSGVTIGEGAIIQAGSVVVKDIPPLSIAGGHPARVFSQRDEAHYYKLKNEGKFF